MKPTIKRSQIAAMNWHYRQYSFDYFLDTIARIGYTSVAIWAGPPHFHIDAEGYEDIKVLRRKLSDRRLSCVSMTAAASQQMYQMGVSGRKHIEDTVKYFTNGARIAAELGTNLLTANSGNGYFEEPAEDCWNRTVETMSRVADAAAEYGVTITVEGLRPPETRTAPRLIDIKRFLQDVNRPNCKPMIDTTAMAVNKENMDDWFEAFPGEILNMHFIDASPQGHLAWGDGVLPLQDMLCCMNRHGYTGPLGLEITDERYFLDPAKASAQTLRVLENYVED